MKTMERVPLFLRHLSHHLQQNYELKYPRVAEKPKHSRWISLPFNQDVCDILKNGTPCSRFRDKEVIEKGILFLDSQHRRLIFKKEGRDSLYSRDIMELTQIIKISTDMGSKTPFGVTSKKLKLSKLYYYMVKYLSPPLELSKNSCLSIISSKVVKGEIDLFILFEDPKVRKVWRDSIKTVIKQISKKK